MDDMPARLIGEQIGQDAHAFAQTYFTPAEPKDIGGGVANWLIWVGLLLIAAVGVFFFRSSQRGRNHE